MKSTTRVKGALTAENTFVGPVSIVSGSATVFVAGNGTGTLTVQIRPTPLPASPGSDIAAKPPVVAETPEVWADLQVVAAGLSFVPAVQLKISGRYDLRVGYKTGAAPTGSATVYLQTEDYAD